MSTWGQLRQELAVSGPGVPLSLLTTFLMRSYREILDYRDWDGLRGNGSIRTVAAVSDGQVSATKGSTAIAGVGTSWSSTMSGRKIRIGLQRESYLFTYLSATTGTLDRPFEGDTATALDYVIFENTYPLPGDVKDIDEMSNPNFGEPMAKRNRGWIESIDPCYEISGFPSFFELAEDSSEDTPPVLKSVQIYPWSVDAIGLPFVYEKAVIEFDGDNTGDSPLPWVSQDAIIAGAKMRLMRHLKDFQSEQSEGAEFMRLLKSMSNNENLSSPAVRLQMDPRFVTQPKGQGRRW